MFRRQAARGDSKIGCIVWLVILLIGGLVGFKAIPVKIHSAQFYDFMENQAQFAGRTSAEDLKKRILRRANELDLPVDKKDLKVTKSSAKVRIECTYTVPLTFPGYTYDWHFDHEIESLVFRF